ncbi:hypothetical protein Scep_006342 [Stephania cephalantha]|uniref:Uncharacterized protein n=1 Tax=Stephania cephalantha TaxID=152367 RepID=A0AAP0KAI2_9MAGN
MTHQLMKNLLLLSSSTDFTFFFVSSSSSTTTSISSAVPIQSNHQIKPLPCTSCRSNIHTEIN